MKVYHKITGIFLLALIVVQLTGINCIDKGDIPFSGDLEYGVTLIHASQSASIDNANNHADSDTSIFDGCPCHFQFIPNPVLASTGISVGLVQFLPAYRQSANLLPGGISKPPRLV